MLEFLGEGVILRTFCNKSVLVTRQVCRSVPLSGPERKSLATVSAPDLDMLQLPPPHPPARVQCLLGQARPPFSFQRDPTPLLHMPPPPFPLARMQEK